MRSAARLLGCGLVLLLGCGTTAANDSAPPAYHRDASTSGTVAPKLAVITSAPPAPGPIGSAWTVAKGDTLKNISERVYGHRQYTSLITAVNSRDADGVIRAGETLQTPPIPEAFRRVHFRYMAFVDLLDRALTDYRSLLKDY